MSSTAPGGGGLGPAPDGGEDASDCVDGASYDGSALGRLCVPACGDPFDCCPDSFIQACKAEGGSLESCVSGDYSCPVNAGQVCVPPAAPATGQFACADVACEVGDVCVNSQPAMDGCSGQYCMAPPSGCTGMPTCACLRANAWSNLTVINCQVDAVGNPTVSVTRPF